MDKQLKISEPEVVIINCDDDNTQLVPKKKMIKGKRQKKRKVQIDSTDNKRLIITQKVKKQKFQCIINLTNICKHKYKSKVTLDSFINKKNKKECEDLRRNSILERVPPRCMRKGCQSAKKSNYHSRQSKKRSTKKENLKTSIHKKNASNRILLSPISTIDLSEEISTISYENISSDSFVESENELETLIKRTRDREKQLIMTFESSSPLRGSPHLVEISSEEDNIKCSESASIHSIATLVLEPHSNLYSPTNPKMCPIENYSSTQIIGSPNKCNRKHRYSNPINMNPEVYTSNMKNVTLHKYPVSTNTQCVSPERDVCLKIEHYSPIIVPTNIECTTGNSFDINTPKCEVLSPTIKSNLEQKISFYSAGTEPNIKKEPYSPVINYSNMYLGPFLHTDSTSHVFQNSDPFEGNAKSICYKLLDDKTED